MKLFLAIIACILLGLSVRWAWHRFSGLSGVDAIEQKREAPFLEPDNAPYQQFLNRVVINGRVDYRTAAQHRSLLDHYLLQVARATPARFEKDVQRLALYLNAYNAMVIQGVLDAGEIKSIEDVGPAHRFFRQKHYQIAGVQVSLHGFESKIIRQYDPRLHFALNCASVSCPPLSSTAFQPNTLDQQLDHLTRQFINDATHNQYDPVENSWHLSKIFQWYAEDFGGAGGVRALLTQYANFDVSPASQLSYRPYDWGLNSVSDRESGP